MTDDKELLMDCMKLAKEIIILMGEGIMRFLETNDKKHLTDCLDKSQQLFKPPVP